MPLPFPQPQMPQGMFAPLDPNAAPGVWVMLKDQIRLMMPGADKYKQQQFQRLTPENQKLMSPTPTQPLMSKAGFDQGFLKRAYAMGVDRLYAIEALEFIKQASPISGKNQTLGQNSATPSLQAPAAHQSPTPSPGLQSVMQHNPLQMPAPRLNTSPMQGPPAPLQIPNTQLGAQTNPMQGPPAPMQMQKPQGAPQPQLGQMMQQQLGGQGQPQLGLKTAPGPLRPPLMPQMNRPMLTQ